MNYLLGDHLGSQAITTDANGSKISEVRYYPWGGDRYYAYTSSTTFRFTGQRTEFGLGLYYYGARWYDPLGRFIQADTIIPGAGNPQAYDRYAYALNNPLKYIDPSGYLSCDAQHVADGDCSDATLEERINYFGINLEGTWVDENLLQILSAVSVIGLKFSLALGNLGTQLVDAFKGVFNGVTFSLDPTLAEKGYYGQASVDQDSFLPGKITNRLIAHELGHTFSYRMARSSGNVYTANHPETLLNTFPGLVNDEGVFMTGEHGGYSRNDGKTGIYGGYLCDTVPCQYHYYKGTGVIMAGALTAGEDWADMFLNWSMGGFSPKPRGNFYNNWMTTNMGEWVSMAAGG